MKVSNIPLSVVSIGLFASASTAFSYCSTFNLPQWECDVCGSQIASSGAIQCAPFNATFDELPAGKPVGIYKSANWHNFQTVDGEFSTPPVPQVMPYSKPNYARLASGKKGVISFGYSNGTEPGGSGQYPLGNLYSYHYACALHAAKPAPQLIPAACNVQVNAKCVPTGSIIDGPEKDFDCDVSYAPTTPQNGTMAFHQGDPARDAGYICSNYTLTAKSLAGVPVDLLLDDVLYRTWRQAF